MADQRDARRGRDQARSWGALRSLGAAALAVSLAGCLVSEAPVELGPRATPLEPGLYLSFDGADGAVEEAFIVSLSKDRVYLTDQFRLAFYESGIEDDLYFVSYQERDEPKVLYGLARAADGVITYPFVDCDLAAKGSPPEGVLRRGSGATGGCQLADAAQGREALAAAWRAGPSQPWSRFVRQTEFRR